MGAIRCQKMNHKQNPTFRHVRDAGRDCLAVSRSVLPWVWSDAADLLEDLIYDIA